MLACAILPNVFTKVHTAIEVDAGSGAALDCVVFPQHVQSGTAGMMLPTALSDSGLMLLGNRKLGSSGLARGVFLPPRQNRTSNPLPSLTGDDAGYMLFDTDNQRIAIWNGEDWI